MGKIFAHLLLHSVGLGVEICVVSFLWPASIWVPFFCLGNSQSCVLVESRPCLPHEAEQARCSLSGPLVTMAHEQGSVHGVLPPRMLELKQVTESGCGIQQPETVQQAGCSLSQSSVRGVSWECWLHRLRQFLPSFQPGSLVFPGIRGGLCYTSSKFLFCLS